LRGRADKFAQALPLADAHLNRGVLLKERGQNAAALASFDQAIGINPTLAPAFSNRGVVLSDLRQFEAALASYDRAIAIDPTLASAHSNRAAVLMALHRWEPALASCDRAIALKPDYADAHSNRGNALKGLARWPEALRSYDRALELRPNFAEAHANRGSVLADLGRWQEALSSYGHAVALRPDFAEARFNRAVVSLLLGDFRGWVDYEWRWLNENGKTFKERRQFSRPLWLGNGSIAGKRILLHAEQGLGDTLQFCRYVKLVADLGAQVIFEVQPPLEELLGALEGVAQLVAKGALLPDFDCHCPLLSLPLAFNTQLGSIPSARGYLDGDAALVAGWQSRLGQKTGPRIGLVWSGNPRNSNDRYRSIALAELIQGLPGEFQYYCLQKDIREADQRTLDSSPGILNFANDLNLRSTAALCALLDAVICVDTSVAHLSGALGRRTLIMLPHNADWRWLLDRDDSPWYSSATLYRQERLGDWGIVLQRLTADLRRDFPIR
jgi:tetratricopeptide (TPR) repeat protein